MNRTIQRAAVIGAGVMGASIAAHLANAGISVLLLDIVPRELSKEEKAKNLSLTNHLVRNRLSIQALKRMKTQNPTPITAMQSLARIEEGNIEDDLDQLKEMDWVIEAVVESLDVKREILKKIEENRGNYTIVSSNTSGLSIHAMTEGRSKEFQSYFLGTHFFNPPRYLKLLEIIPHKKTAPHIIQFMKKFAEETLGKNVVLAKDTPNFIANRIGTFGLLVIVREMLRNSWSVGEVDSLTGTLIGRPKSATFRTLDIVGVDTFLHVAQNAYNHASGKEKEVFKVPSFMKKMVEKGWYGSKAGQGFYKKVKHTNGSEILEIDPYSLRYEPKKKTNLVISMRSSNGMENLKNLIYSEEEAGRFLWSIVKPLLLYTAEKQPEIATDIAAVDDAMKWGFGWELGPFEMWDAIGVKTSIQKMEAEGEIIPAWIKVMLNAGIETFYKNGYTYYHGGTYKSKESNSKVIHLRSYKENNQIISKNTGGTLLHVGDDIACLELHSPNDAIGMDAIQMILKSVHEAENNYKGLIISSQSKNFCVGANLMLILLEALEGNFYELDFVVRQFQKATKAIKYAKRPVIIVPHGMTLGGGAEICLPAANIQAAAETYMGLVETGVGLIPGGGGCKELYLRHLEHLPRKDEVSNLEITNNVFKTIALGKVSTSAEEAKAHGFIGPKDNIIMNDNHTLYYAKQKVIELFSQGYVPPLPEKIPVTGESGYAALKLGAKLMQFGGAASEHDIKVANKLAFVLAGGNIAKGTLVDEQYLLDLEREAFLSLAGEPKTQARMQYMLKKGKPLRN